MRRLVAACCAALLTGLLVMVAPSAQAASGNQITRFDVTVSLDQAGTMTVNQTVDLAFATAGHGLELTYLIRQGTDDPSRERLYDYSDFTVTSPTGAPTDVDTERDDTVLGVRIGDPDITVSGTQTYQISYTVSGILNPKVEGSGLDELYWKVIPPGWTLPISNVSVTVNGLADVSQATCYIATTSAELGSCASSRTTGTTATYTHTQLSPGEGLTIGAGWPAGTYPQATVNLVPASQSPLSLDGNGAWVGGGALALSGAAGWWVTRLRRRGRDEQFANVTPGEQPAAGDKVEYKYEEVTDAPVQFAPPRGLPPRLVGAAVHEASTNEDISATIIDLAVHGYLKVEPRGGNDFAFHRTNLNLTALGPIEHQVLDGLFAKGPVVSRDDLSDEDFAETYNGFHEVMQAEFDAQPWFKANPAATTRTYQGIGLIIAVAGTILALILGTSLAENGIVGVGWLALPCIVLGLGLVIVARRMSVRTALGSAVTIQSLGFKKYLETAEADQLRWEEGQDIFSQYLPYAIAFGCADRWAGIFQELAARGVAVPMPDWYVGSWGVNYLMWSSIGSSMGSIGSSISESLMASTAAQASATFGSSGGSAFGGGGGMGGVGGGGGGSW